ncbi:hypothetical protein [Pseudomonas sp. Au-Pse12]|uniref:hypothetical protein n=1 Tax=Pseudomonas sp. Au-Pse12 TaxID=2906459 RepID=UPI001E5425BE|nr:hypothetical protein [Pseudomonas sp. Au-Pse12]MCE4058484.1 hypothetical protein [Pseudomonas sp. Au-Pse12]
MIALKNDDVIGAPGQNLSELEQTILVAMANGNTQPAIMEATQTDPATFRMIEMQVRKKLGASTPGHMISRGFVLGVLIPRALCLLLSTLCAVESADDGNRNQTRRNSRTAPASRLARNSVSRAASGPGDHHESARLAECFQITSALRIMS